MEDERQITVRGEPPPIEAWVRWISDPDIAGWSRGIEIERKLKQKRDARWPMCLVWSGEGLHPKTALFLRPGSGSSIVVTSVAPIDRKELTLGDRRAALDAFQAALISSKVDGLVVEDKPSPTDLPETISPQAVARFASFVRTAGKPLLHAGLDLPRWYDFLIQLHQDQCWGQRQLLEEALRNHAFADSVIRELLAAYDHADGLLTRYDFERD